MPRGPASRVALAICSIRSKSAPSALSSSSASRTSMRSPAAARSRASAIDDPSTARAGSSRVTAPVLHREPRGGSAIVVRSVSRDPRVRTPRPSAENTSSSQSSARRLTSERFIISQWVPAPSAAVKSMTVALGSAAAKSPTAAARGSFSARVSSTGQRICPTRSRRVNCIVWAIRPAQVGDAVRPEPALLDRPAHRAVLPDDSHHLLEHLVVELFGLRSLLGGRSEPLREAPQGFGQIPLPGVGDARRRCAGSPDAARGAR